MAIECTTRVDWAKGLFESVEEFETAETEGGTSGLILKYDEDGTPYLDEGECQGPFAGEDE